MKNGVGATLAVALPLWLPCYWQDRMRRLPETGVRRPETGDWSPESGEWRMENGEWRMETGPDHEILCKDQETAPGFRTSLEFL
ncbi:MAG: hypothetical protein ACOZDD_05550 [Bacteroidota bacterium]